MLNNYTERNDVAMMTVYVGQHYELNISTATATSYCYYTFAGQRIALRVRNMNTGVMQVQWLHGDHLSSASATTDANGAKTSEYRYTPYGSVRVAWGSLPMNRKFTGYAREDTLGGIDYAQARFYDPLIGRFLSPDTIVPNPADPQSLNRFSYVRNSPLVYTDPTGHAEDCNCDGNGIIGPPVPMGPIRPLWRINEDLYQHQWTNWEWRQVKPDQDATLTILAVTGIIMCAMTPCGPAALEAIKAGAKPYLTGVSVEFLGQILDNIAQGKSVTDPANYNLSELNSAGIGNAVGIGVFEGVSSAPISSIAKIGLSGTSAGLASTAASCATGGACDAKTAASNIVGQMASPLLASTFSTANPLTIDVIGNATGRYLTSFTKTALGPPNNYAYVFSQPSLR